jgi:septal ring factor EnvC (AmiA/AmiB activator)
MLSVQSFVRLEIPQFGNRNPVGVFDRQAKAEAIQLRRGMAAAIDAALRRLEAALDLLEGAMESRLEGAQQVTSLEHELHRLGTDRSRLAQSLDTAEARTAKLEDANREVSRRLVNAMESIRTVLDRQGA